MKKILGALAALSLVATSSLVVISCGNKGKETDIKIADVKKAVQHIQNKNNINEVNEELNKVEITNVEKLEAFVIDGNKRDVTIKVSVKENKTIDENSFVLKKAIKDTEVIPEGKYSITLEEYIKKFPVTPGADKQFNGDWNIDYWETNKLTYIPKNSSNQEIKKIMQKEWVPPAAFSWDEAIAVSITGIGTKWYDLFPDKKLLPEGISFIDNLLEFKSADIYDSQKSMDTPANLDGEEVNAVDGYYEVSMTSKAIEYLKTANNAALLEYFEIDSEDTEDIAEFNETFKIYGSIKVNFVIYRE